MRKAMIILSLAAFGIGSVDANQLNQPVENPISWLVQDKVKIAPEDLPQVIKDSIEENEELKAKPVFEAYQVSGEDGSIQYEITFGLEEDKVTKKFDSEGNELEN